MPAAGSQPLPPPRTPVGFSAFPGEIWRTPRSWAEQSYPTLSYFGEAERGGIDSAGELGAHAAALPVSMAGAADSDEVSGA